MCSLATTCQVRSDPQRQEVPYLARRGGLLGIHPLCRRCDATGQEDPGDTADRVAPQPQRASPIPEHDKLLPRHGAKQTTLCQPLYRFTSSKVPFTWLPSETATLRAIEKAFAEVVLLSFPGSEKPFHVYAGASDMPLVHERNQDLGVLITQPKQAPAQLHDHGARTAAHCRTAARVPNDSSRLPSGRPHGPQKPHYPSETCLKDKRWKRSCCCMFLSCRLLTGCLRLWWYPAMRSAQAVRHDHPLWRLQPNKDTSW